MLREWTFEGANGGQIEKFHLDWKVDRYTFPTRTPGAHFDIGNTSKSGSKQVQCIDNLALPIEEKLPV